MYHSNFHTKIIIFNIIDKFKHIPSKALVSQWVHPFRFTFSGRHSMNIVCKCCSLVQTVGNDNFLFKTNPFKQTTNNLLT